MNNKNALSARDHLATVLSPAMAPPMENLPPLVATMERQTLVNSSGKLAVKLRLAERMDVRDGFASFTSSWSIQGFAYSVEKGATHPVDESDVLAALAAGRSPLHYVLAERDATRDALSAEFPGFSLSWQRGDALRAGEEIGMDLMPSQEKTGANLIHVELKTLIDGPPAGAKLLLTRTRSLDRAGGSWRTSATYALKGHSRSQNESTPQIPVSADIVEDALRAGISPVFELLARDAQLLLTIAEQLSEVRIRLQASEIDEGVRKNLPSKRKPPP